LIAYSEQYHIPQDRAAGRWRSVEALQEGRVIDDGTEYKPICRGWFLGDEALKEE
jgi:hypothetical protein